EEVEVGEADLRGARVVGGEGGDEGEQALHLEVRGDGVPETVRARLAEDRLHRRAGLDAAGEEVAVDEVVGTAEGLRGDDLDGESGLAPAGGDPLQLAALRVAVADEDRPAAGPARAGLRAVGEERAAEVVD